MNQKVFPRDIKFNQQYSYLDSCVIMHTCRKIVEISGSKWRQRKRSLSVKTRKELFTKSLFNFKENLEKQVDRLYVLNTIIVF